MKKKMSVLILLISTLVFGLLMYRFLITKQKNTTNEPHDITFNKQLLDVQNDYEISQINNTDLNKIIDINIETITTKIAGVNIERWLYTNHKDKQYDSSLPIVVNVGDQLTLDVQNNTQETTNIHWHGMSVNNDQDGPGLLINPNQTHQYQFNAEEAGTYWYHSHERPVRDQVDGGMYGPFIVKSKADMAYSKDYILMLDDWSIKGVEDNSRNGMHMEIVGNVDTVNGRSGQDILPVIINKGELHKLRFIGSSTALTHELQFPMEVRVTHTDGRALEKPYYTSSLLVAPGERYDVELSIDDAQDSITYITNNRNNGLSIPIVYTAEVHGSQVESPFISATPSGVLESTKNKQPDIYMKMSTGGMHSNNGKMAWTINGEIYPNLEAFNVEVGKMYIVRFESDNGMHSMAHPMHIHGAHFTPISLNGKPYTSEMKKDTISVPAGSYIDVAIQFDKPGDWMVHCHILDHEDGGMMTSIIAQ